MSAEKKRKKKKPVQVEKEWYHIEIDVDDWDVYYHFSTATRYCDDGAYWEASSLSLKGKILAPSLKSASKAKIDIAADPK